MNSETPPTAEALSRQLDMPIRLVRAVLADLTEARLVAEVCPPTGQATGYQPACDLDLLTVAGVIERLNQRGITKVPIVDSAEVQKLRDIVDHFRQTNEQSPANLRLRTFSRTSCRRNPRFTSLLLFPEWLAG